MMESLNVEEKMMASATKKYNQYFVATPLDFYDGLNSLKHGLC